MVSLTWYKLFFNSPYEWASIIGAVGKISAFRLQGPQFDSWFFPDLNICATFFSAKANSAFHPSAVGKWVPASAGSLPAMG